MSLLSLLLSLIAGLFFFSCTDHSDVVDPNDRQDIASWNSSEKGPSADVLSSSSNLEENASSIFSSSSSSVSILSSLAPSSSVEVSSSSASLSSSLSQSSSVALNSSVTASSSLSAETNASSSSVEKDQSSSAASKKDVVWDATDAVGQLQGGIYDGYWYSYTDSGDAGNSIVVPANPFSSTDSASYDWIGTYITDSCGGASLCAVMTFGNAIDYPYVGIGVNFLDPQAEVDVSSKYVCFSYTATQAWRLNLRFSSSNESDMAFNVPGWAMKTATARTTVSKAFSSATQQSGWGTEITVADYLDVVEALAFQYMGSLSDTGSVNNLNIYDLAISDSDCSAEVGDQ